MVDQAKIRATLENARQTKQVYKPRDYKPEFYVKNDDPVAPRALGGLDPEWEKNYASDVKTGPRGEELPSGAEAWTKNGLPYFGEGFAAYGNKLKWSWNKHNTSSDESMQEARAHADEQMKAWKDFNLGKILAEGAKTWLSLAKSAIGGKVDEETGEVAATLPQKVGRSIAITLETAIDVTVQAATEAKAQIFGRVAGVREIAKRSQLGEFGGEAYQEFRKKAEEKRAEQLIPDEDDTKFDKFVKSESANKWVYGFIRDFPLNVSNIWDAVRALEAPISSKEKKDITERNIAAAKITATGWIDVAVQEEFIRRYEGGENPYLLKQELENPIAEGVLEAIVDPLNFLGPVFRFVRGGKKVIKISSVVDDTSDLGVAVNAFGDVGANATDAGKLLDDVVDAKIAANAVVDGRVAVTQAARGITARTATTKQTQIAETFGDWLGPLSTMMFEGEPGNLVFQSEKMGDVLKIALGLASDVRAEVETAVIAASQFEGVSSKFLLSDSGHVVGKTLRSILSDADGVVDATKIVNQMRGYEKIDDVIEHFASVVKKYGDELFPTIIQRAEAPAKIKALQAAGKEVPESLIEMTKMPLRMDERIFLAAEKFKKSTPVSKIDTFYAHVYMGASPGYYARNSINNFLTAFVDNPNTIWKTHKQSLNTIESLGARVIESAKKGIGASGRTSDKRTIFNFFMHSAAESEAKMSARIVAQSMRETFTAMAPRAMQEVKKITSVPDSFNPSVWDNISSIWRSKNYNVADTLETLAEAQKMKTYDVYKSFEWVDDTVREGLESADLYDDIIAESGKLVSKDEITSFYDEKIQGVMDDANLSFSEIGNAEYEIADEVSLAIKEMPGGSEIKISNDVRGFANTATSANVYAENKLRSAVYSIIQDGVTRDGGIHSQGVQEVFRVVVDDIVDELGTLLGTTPPAVGASSRSAVDFFTTITDGFHAAWRGRADVLRNPTDVVTEASRNVIRFWDNYIEPYTGIKYKKGLSSKEAVNAYYELVYYGKRAEHYADARDALDKAASLLAKGLTDAEVPYDLNAVNEAIKAVSQARRYDTAIVSGAGNKRLFYELGVDGKANYERLRRLAHMNGLPPIEFAGKNGFLDVVNNFSDDVYKNVSDIPSSVAEDAIRQHTDDIGRAYTELAPDVGKAADDADWLTKGEAPALNSSYHHATDAGITPFAAAQQTSSGIIADLERMREGALGSFGKTSSYDAGFANAAEARKFYKALGNQLDEKLLDIRATSGEVATAKRNFALLDYDDRRNVDTMLATVYPFHYWHSRTYVNWLKRVVQKPGLLSGYAHYKDTLATIHSEQPEWWKYNINTNELLGMNAKNPLYFNLEATLNPLNGIMGVDFNDSKRRVNFMSAVLDDLGKLGPATWTPFSLAMAAALDVEGEEEAAARWGSQVFSQTRSMTALLSMIEDGASFAGIEFEGLGEGATGGLLDRFMDPYALAPVSIFSGGIDPYVRGRIGRAMAAMENEGFILNGELVTKEEYIDAARIQEGDIWNAAYRRAINERAPGQVSSFVAGVGFKGRTQSDIEIDDFYSEFYAFIRNQDNLSSEEVRRGYDQMRQQFPFMDTLLLARKGGDERDQAYAYSVLSRIPPGDSEIAEVSGMNPDIMNKFYETKGKFSEWPEDEQLGFMQSIVTLGSILEIPSDGTRQEWTAARNQSALIRDTMEEMWGEDIHDDINLFYDTDDEEKDEYLVGHPAVEEALDWKANQIANAPESYIAAYYGGIDQIEKFYNNRMNREIDEKIPNMDEIWDEYGAIGDRKERKAYRNSHPEIQTYYDIRDKWEGFILEQMDELGSRLREGEPVQLRDTDEASIFAEEVREAVEAPPAVAVQDIMVSARRIGGEALIENIDTWQWKGSMSATTQAALEEVAKDLGIGFKELLDTLK